MVYSLVVDVDLDTLTVFSAAHGVTLASFLCANFVLQATNVQGLGTRLEYLFISEHNTDSCN